MRGDPWRPWLKTSPELLARYVNEEAAAKAMQKGFLGPHGADRFRSVQDLRQARHLLEMLRVLYDELCRAGIVYDLGSYTI